jgi:hypothetical protein
MELFGAGADVAYPQIPGPKEAVSKRLCKGFENRIVQRV